MRLFNVSVRCSFVNKMADKTRNPDRSNTETSAPAHDASQPMRTRDFTGSSLCHIILSFKKIHTYRSISVHYTFCTVSFSCFKSLNTSSMFVSFPSNCFRSCLALFNDDEAFSNSSCFSKNNKNVATKIMKKSQECLTRESSTLNSAPKLIRSRYIYYSSYFV